MTKQNEDCLRLILRDLVELSRCECVIVPQKKVIINHSGRKKKKKNGAYLFIVCLIRLIF
jgi:hypothetical protein